MSIFDNGAFYPTPPALRRKMLGPIGSKDLAGKYILEPSAGKGDLLDAIREACYDYRQPYLYAVEIEPELRAILQEKGYAVIGDDFLAYAPTTSFDFIIMNPPFDRCADHVLHAWEILSHGKVVSVVPETLFTSSERKPRLLCELIEQHGEVEHCGSLFKEAERKTNVEVAIVRMTKVNEQLPEFEFRVSNDRATPDFDDGPGGELQIRGFIAELMQAHDAAVAAYTDYTVARTRVLRYLKPLDHYCRTDLVKPYAGSDRVEEKHESIDVMRTADLMDGSQARYNEFVRLITESAWNKILDHPDFQALLTDRARQMLTRFRQGQQRVDFNPQNVRYFFEALRAMQGELFNGAVLDAFDTMTKYHEDNRIYVEGWKSNKAWMVSQKVVLPRFIMEPPNSFDIRYENQAKLDDIDRALCIVSGRDFRTIRTVSAAVTAKLKEIPRLYGSPQAGSCESTFFNIRFFKKRTIHLQFKDEDVWALFNQAAAQGKNWLPPGHKVKPAAASRSAATRTARRQERTGRLF